jgi:hypothetical protein
MKSLQRRRQMLSVAAWCMMACQGFAAPGARPASGVLPLELPKEWMKQTLNP